MRKTDYKTVLVKLDDERHRALRVLSAQQSTSMQALMVAAVDQMLATPQPTVAASVEAYFDRQTAAGVDLLNPEGAK